MYKVSQFCGYTSQILSLVSSHDVLLLENLQKNIDKAYCLQDDY